MYIASGGLGGTPGQTCVGKIDELESIQENPE